MSKKNPYAAKRPGKPRPPKAAPSLVDGTIKEVLAAVGDDREKAAQALEEEQAKESPRSTLVKTLTELLEAEAEAEAEAADEDN